MKRKHLDIYADYPSERIDAAIRSWVHSERDRRIMHHKIVNDLTYEKVAEIMDMSPKGIQKIVYKYEPKLMKELRESK